MFFFSLLVHAKATVVSCHRQMDFTDLQPTMNLSLTATSGHCGYTPGNKHGLNHTGKQSQIWHTWQPTSTCQEYLFGIKKCDLSRREEAMKRKYLLGL